MRVCVDMGHTPTSPGASGYLDELTEDRRIGAALINELQARGHEVVGTTPGDGVGYPDEINQRVATANASGAELFVSIHLNAGGGTGTEVLYFAGDAYGLATAQQVSANVAGVLGLRDRGAKPRTTEIGVIRDTVMTAVLVEVCFVDSQQDADAYRASSPEAVAAAIASGIEGKPAEAPTAPSQPVTDGGSGTGDDFTGGLYRCTVDALNVRDRPSLGGAVVATYAKGQTVYLDNWYAVADGYVWARYTAYSGATRYVAVGRHTGQPEADDYLVRA